MTKAPSGDRDLASPPFWESYHRSRTGSKNVNLSIPPFRRLDRLLRKHLPPGGGRFIELGCGSSSWLAHFRRVFGYEVWGLDVSLAGCRNARRNVRSGGAEAAIVQGDLFSSPVRPALFDVVFSMGLVEHFSRPEESIAAHARLLSPRGFLVVAVPNLMGVDGWVLRRGNPRAHRLHRPVGPEELARWAACAGLEPLFSGYAGGIGLFLSMIRPPSMPRLVHRMIRKTLAGIHGLLWVGLDRKGRWRDSRRFSPFVLCIAQKEAK